MAPSRGWRAKSSTTVLDLIAAEQAHPSRGTTMLGDTREGIAAELGDVAPDWTAERPGGPPGRPHRRRGRRRLGRRGRPGLDPGPVGRRRRRGLAPWARPLVESSSTSSRRTSTTGSWRPTSRTRRMAELGAELGLPASEVSHVYSVDAATVETWPEPPGRSDRHPRGRARRSVRCTTRSSRRRTPPSSTWCPSRPTASSTWSSRRTGRSSSGTPPAGSSPTARATSTSSRSRTPPAAGAPGGT